MIKKRKNRIRKTDFLRVLITETLPYETPIIFSNDGLYELLKSVNSLDPTLRQLIQYITIGEGENKPSTPYLYKIRKDSKEYRQLGLIHQRAQSSVKDFYKKYYDLILYHCSHSPSSIRAPNKVAGSFYFKNLMENLNQYKDVTVFESSADEVSKHSPSFFSYRGFNRLYKFFQSIDYIGLEKKYAVMRTLDVAKCFDSIYTHTLSWAIKDKSFTKEHVQRTATFAQQFDALMQRANHSETNGIVIGPEVSRIFSEILFQEIDIQAIQKLSTVGRRFDADYSFRRYVDDVFIFAKNADMAQQVYECYADTLSKFNLHANASKSVLIERPFVTTKSRLIHQTSIEVNQFIDKFVKTDGDDFNILQPKDVRSPWKLTRNFIETIKSICSHNAVSYDEIAPYLIAVLSERVKKIVALKSPPATEIEKKQYFDAIAVLLEVLYFFYEVAPSVGSSYKICTATILSIRFTKKHIKDMESSVAHRVFELAESLLRGFNFNQKSSNPLVDRFLPLEAINIMLSTRELGSNYLMPEDFLLTLFGKKKLSYFEIVSCLFYIKDDHQYSALRKVVLKEIRNHLSNLTDIHTNSEKSHLLLDMLFCPYIPDQAKIGWTNALRISCKLSALNTVEITKFLTALNASFAHVNWNNTVDLLRSLEKKELKQAY